MEEIYASFKESAKFHLLQLLSVVDWSAAQKGLTPAVGCRGAWLPDLPIAETGVRRVAVLGSEYPSDASRSLAGYFFGYFRPQQAPDHS